MFELLSFSGAVRTAGSVLLALVILLAMITVHECGHYLAGRLLRFRIQEFSVGFGPALFKQERLGKGGRPFTIYKYRSMGLDAEVDGPQWAEKDDSRCTRLGRTLRKTRLRPRAPMTRPSRT